MEPGSVDDVSKIVLDTWFSDLPGTLQQFKVRFYCRNCRARFWDQVYTGLDPTGLNVIRARLPGVGVAGVTLGGDECLSSDALDSLTVDSVKGFRFNATSTAFRSTRL